MVGKDPRGSKGRSLARWEEIFAYQNSEISRRDLAGGTFWSWEPRASGSLISKNARRRPQLIAIPLPLSRRGVGNRRGYVRTPPLKKEPGARPRDPPQMETTRARWEIRSVSCVRRNNAGGWRYAPKMAHFGNAKRSANYGFRVGVFQLLAYPDNAPHPPAAAAALTEAP